MRLVLREKQSTEEGIQSTGDYAAISSDVFTRNTGAMMDETSLEDAGSAKKHPHIAMMEECGCACNSCMSGEHHEEDEESEEELTQRVLAGLYDDPEAIYIVIGEEELNERKKRKVE